MQRYTVFITISAFIRESSKVLYHSIYYHIVPPNRYALVFTFTSNVPNRFENIYFNANTDENTGISILRALVPLNTVMWQFLSFWPFLSF